MHIEINIFPNSFPTNPIYWKIKMAELHVRIAERISESTVHSDSGTLGNHTLLDDDGMIIATIDIRRD